MDPVFAGLAAAVIVLQLVTIALVLSTRGLVVRPQKKDEDIALPAKPREEPPQRREDPQNNRRRDFAPPAKRPEPPLPAPATGQVDRTLRDINLRLKSAERDQERARREMRDPSQTGQQQQGPRRGDQYPRRGDRDRGRGRDDRHSRGGYRPDGRGPSNGPRPESRYGDQRPQGYRPEGQRAEGPRMESPRPVSTVSTDAEASSPAPVFERPAPVSPIAEVRVSAVAAMEPPVPSEPQGDLEHGRRNMVKRRPLDTADASSSDASSAPASDSSASAEPSAGVVYGRR